MADVEVTTQTPKVEPEPVSERDRQIEGYHRALHSLFKGADDVMVAQSVASFMGCTMAHSDDWRRVIPGFVQEMLDYANLAQQAHLHSETIAQPEVPQNGNQSTEEA